MLAHCPEGKPRRNTFPLTISHTNPTCESEVKLHGKRTCYSQKLILLRILVELSVRVRHNMRHEFRFRL